MKLELEGAISVVAYDATSGTEHIHNVRTSTLRARLSGLKRGGSGRRLASEGVVAAAFIVSRPRPRWRGRCVGTSPSLLTYLSRTDGLSEVSSL